MSKRKDNISTIFLLPVVGISKAQRNMFYTYGYVNSYMYCNMFKQNYPVLYLLFKPSKVTGEFINFISNIQKNPNFISQIVVNSCEVILVYKIPDEYAYDYILFEQGKYSKMSKSFKSNFDLEKIKINSFGRPERDRNNSIIYEPTDFYHIFNKTQIMRAHWVDTLNVNEDNLPDELFDVIDTNKETLILNTPRNELKISEPKRTGNNTSVV